LLRKPVYHVDVVGERLEKVRHFFGRILQIVIERDDDWVLCLSNASQECRMLARVASEAEPSYATVVPRELFDYMPCRIGVAVIDNYHL